MFITVHFKEAGKHTGYCSNTAISHGTNNILIVFSVNFLFHKVFFLLRNGLCKTQQKYIGMPCQSLGNISTDQFKAKSISSLKCVMLTE